MSEKLNRKDFLKVAGLSAITFPVVNIVERIGRYELVESKELYGDFLIRRLSKGTYPYEIDDNTFERFEQHNNMFGRASWDETHQSNLAAVGPSRENDLKKREAGVPGFNVFESSLQDAGWWLARNRGANPYGWVTEENPIIPQIDGFSDEEVTNYVKKACLFYGAADVGIAELNENWFYKTIGYDPEDNKPLIFEDVDLPINASETPEIVIPKSMNRVIVFTLQMDYDAFAAGGVNKVSSAAAGLGYSHMAFVAGTLADFIRKLGFQAIPSGNDTGLSIPMAIDAGLGEDSRMGMLITPKNGPRIRLAKVITDMPLLADSPITFGVNEFCEVCGACAEYCPSGTIPTPKALPKKSYEPYDINNIRGVKKWQVRQASCHVYWSKAGVGCSNCLSVCPFNKPQGWLHDATRALIEAKSSNLNSLMATLDEASGYGGTTGEDVDPGKIDYFWNKKEEYIHRRS